MNQALFEKAGVEIIGVILNKVIGEKIDYVADFARRGLKRKGLELLGVLPYEQTLCNPSMDLIREELQAESLNAVPALQALVGDVIVGAMSAQNAMKFFKPGVLLITPGDREDIVLAACTAIDAQSTEKMAGIVLTGGLRPPESILKIIRTMPIPVLLAQADSYQVASKVHNLTVKTRPSDADKNFPHPRHRREKRQPQENPAIPVIPTPTNTALKTLPSYQPGRPIEEVARELNLPANEIIKLASNENPLGPSPLALAAMQKVLANLNLYPDGNAFYLKQKLAEKLGVAPANLVLGNGSNEIIEFVGHTYFAPGVDVVVSQFCFAIYPLVTKLFGANLITVPAKDYGHDLPAMLRAITPETQLVFVANPNNPTGTLVPREEVIRFVNDVPDHVLLVMDEAYIEFLDDPLDLASLVQIGARPNLLLMRTFSKIFGLAGLRIGYGIGHPDLIVALEKIRQPFNINSIAQAGALAALGDEEHIRKTRQNNFAGLEFFQRAFRAMKLEYVQSAANFLLMRVGEGQRVFEALQKLGVIVRPMGGYQMPEWIRISVGTPKENERCLDSLKRVLPPSQK